MARADTYKIRSMIRDIPGPDGEGYVISSDTYDAISSALYELDHVISMTAHYREVLRDVLNPG